MSVNKIYWVYYYIDRMIDGPYTFREAMAEKYYNKDTIILRTIIDKDGKELK